MITPFIEDSKSETVKITAMDKLKEYLEKNYNAELHEIYDELNENLKATDDVIGELYNELDQMHEANEDDLKNINWVAYFNANDKKDNCIVKVGVNEEDYETNTILCFVGLHDTEKKAIADIKKRWGKWKTFKLIRK